MKSIVRILVSIIVASWGIGSVFADNTGSTTLKPIQQKESIKTLDTTDADEDTQARKEKIKEEVTSYIIDSYKAQGDKIIKDLDQTLQKTIPEKTARIEAYKKIEMTLESRRTYNKNSQKITETSKKIIDAFLSHMIDSIEKKVSDLAD